MRHFHSLGPSVRTLLRRAFLNAVTILSPALAAAQTSNPSTDWVGYNGNYRGDRYSPLSQITPANASSLHSVCMFDTGEQVSFQSAPTVVSGVMYVTTEMATYALDAATCAPKWKHSHTYSPAPYLTNNRGVAYLNGRLYRLSGDVHAYAIDASDGRTVWDVAIGDRTKGEGAPLAPVAWSGMVFVGNSGGDNFGVTGRILALDANDGHQLWRFDVVPDTGMPRRTWPKASADNPPTGGATWTSYSLDTLRGILYASTGNPAPDFVEALRPGDNLYTNSILALDARSGRLLGWVQPSRRDFHDWDVSPPPAIITTRAGHEMLAAASKAGLLYGIDVGGSARSPQLRVRWSTPVSTRSNTTTPLNSRQWTHFCPGTQGGAEWNGAAYQPRLNLLYVPTIDWCTSIKLQSLDTLKGKPGQAWTGSDDPNAPFGRFDPVEKWGGWVYAVDADNGRMRWRYHSSSPLVAGITATEGGVVFTGDVLGNVLAFDAATGKLLWQGVTQNAVGGGVISYSANGKQYVAAAVGMKSPIWPVPSQSARVVVFALP
jgi:alcohol dehydrogenase (cytochrome c)